MERFFNRSQRSFSRSHRSFYRSSSRFLRTDKRLWNERAARNGDFERHMFLRTIINLVSLTVCFVMTITEQERDIQACFYLAELAIYLTTDPLEIIDRLLAPQSRSILSLLSIVSMIAILHKGRSFGIITGFFIIAGLAAIKIMNRPWLSVYNWLLSAEVQKALRLDPEHTAVQAWKAHGRRETRTMLYELGHNNVKDEALDVLHRPVYLCGYLNGLKKAACYEKQLEKTKELADQAAVYKEKYDILQRETEERESEFATIKRRIETESGNADYWRKMYQKEKTINDQLMTANEELLATISEPKEIVEQSEQLSQTKDQIRDERVLKALDAGMSLSEAAKLAGCSKTTAWKIAQKTKETQEEPA